MLMNKLLLSAAIDLVIHQGAITGAPDGSSTEPSEEPKTVASRGKKPTEDQISHPDVSTVCI
jgi:hypothetical protein